MTAFLEVKHKHDDDPVASLDYAHVTKSIIYATMKLEKSAIRKLSRRKTQHVERFMQPKKNQ